MEPHASDSADKGKDMEKMMLKLDELFEQYLNLLDHYQTTRQQLSTQLSLGYMSLAQANFSSTSRTRYGQDYYDERMQATRKVKITEKGSEGEDVVVRCSLELEEQGEPDTESKSGSEEKQTAKHEGEDDERTKDEATKDTAEKPKATPRDPIRWFGVLVPPPLRSAQSRFVEVVEGPIPQLVTLTKELRILEIEIGRTRKSIKKLEKI